MRGEPIDGAGHDLGIELLAIAGHEHVADLVDETHGIKLTGVDGKLGVVLGVANRVHAVRKFAAGRDVGQNHVSVVGE